MLRPSQYLIDYFCAEQSTPDKLRKSTARLAQSAERKALNLVVVGSSPTVGVSHDRPQNGRLIASP